MTAVMIKPTILDNNTDVNDRAGILLNTIAGISPYEISPKTISDLIIKAYAANTIDLKPAVEAGTSVWSAAGGELKALFQKNTQDSLGKALNILNRLEEILTDLTPPQGVRDLSDVISCVRTLGGVFIGKAELVDLGKTSVKDYSHNQYFPFEVITPEFLQSPHPFNKDEPIGKHILIVRPPDGGGWFCFNTLMPKYCDANTNVTIGDGQLAHFVYEQWNKLDKGAERVVFCLNLANLYLNSQGKSLSDILPPQMQVSVVDHRGNQAGFDPYASYPVKIDPSSGEVSTFRAKSDPEFMAYATPLSVWKKKWKGE